MRAGQLFRHHMHTDVGRAADDLVSSRSADEFRARTPRCAVDVTMCVKLFARA